MMYQSNSFFHSNFEVGFEIIGWMGCLKCKFDLYEHFISNSKQKKKARWILPVGPPWMYSHNGNSMKSSHIVDTKIKCNWINWNIICQHSSIGVSFESKRRYHFLLNSMIANVFIEKCWNYFVGTIIRDSLLNSYKNFKIGYRSLDEVVFSTKTDILTHIQKSVAANIVLKMKRKQDELAGCRCV